MCDPIGLQRCTLSQNGDLNNKEVDNTRDTLCAFIHIPDATYPLSTVTGLLAVEPMLQQHYKDNKVTIYSKATQ